MEEVLMWFIIGWVVLLYIVSCMCINRYASRLGYSSGEWIAVAIIFSPIIAIILLYACGETDEHRKMRMMEEK